MQESANSLVPVPDHMKGLRFDDGKGYLVPWFVQWDGNTPMFPVMDSGKLIRAIREGRCWVCGNSLGVFRASVVGPMCAVNRVSAEPPSHRDCALFSVMKCPFLTNPRRGRRDVEGAVAPAGMMIERNPGVSLVWISKGGTPFNDGRGGILFDIGDPEEALWYSRGRLATREEVKEAHDSGIPILRDACETEGDHAALTRLEEKAMALWPA